MADGFRELSLDTIKTNEGITELNRMIKFLFDNLAGDGETVKVFRGYATPEGAVVASVGAIYQRLDGGASTSIYIKESGAGATGWIPK